MIFLKSVFREHESEQEKLIASMQKIAKTAK